MRGGLGGGGAEAIIFVSSGENGCQHVTLRFVLKSIGRHLDSRVTDFVPACFDALPCPSCPCLLPWKLFSDTVSTLFPHATESNMSASYSSSSRSRWRRYHSDGTPSWHSDVVGA